uniref:Uncharacterized protein n=1 Tax=Trachelomonas grandis TaxID=215769 RepID=A0A385ULV9_9EUGL|nr:hypothetical protein [Trachelomonas grandis]
MLNFIYYLVILMIKGLNPFDARVLFLQSKFLDLYIYGKYKSLRRLQKIYLNSLVLRFNVIRDCCLYNIYCNHYLDLPVLESSYFVISLNLNKFMLLKNNFFLTTRKKSSLFF